MKKFPFTELSNQLNNREFFYHSSIIKPIRSQAPPAHTYPFPLFCPTSRPRSSPPPFLSYFYSLPQPFFSVIFSCPNAPKPICLQTPLVARGAATAPAKAGLYSNTPPCHTPYPHNNVLSNRLSDKYGNAILAPAPQGFTLTRSTFRPATPPTRTITSSQTNMPPNAARCP